MSELEEYTEPEEQVEIKTDVKAKYVIWRCVILAWGVCSCLFFSVLFCPPFAHPASDSSLTGFFHVCLVNRGSYASINTSSFRDFLLKPELLQAINDAGFEHPSEGAFPTPDLVRARVVAPQAAARLKRRPLHSC